MQKYIAGGVAMFALLLALLSTPAAAQGPTVTVTPWPGPVATVTAAAQQSADVDEQLRRGRALKSEAQNLIDDANSRAASIDRALRDSQAALAAQQYGVALEAANRASSELQYMRDNATSKDNLISRLSEINDSQAVSLTNALGELSSLRDENQSLRTDKQTILANYNAAIEQQDQRDKDATLLSIFGSLVGLALIAWVIAWLAQVMRRRNTPQPFAQDVARDDDEPQIIDGE